VDATLRSILTEVLVFCECVLKSESFDRVCFDEVCFEV